MTRDQPPGSGTPHDHTSLPAADITPAEQNYTERATTAIVAAARGQHELGGWLAEVLATAAAELGSTAALTSGRPGSWEADLVQQLVRGTVGWNDDYLHDYAKEPRS